MQSSQQESLSFYFYNVLIRFYIPFEAKYIGLRGKKDKALIQKLIHYYMLYILPFHNDRITLEEFKNKHITRLNDIFNNAMKEYIELLLELVENNNLQFIEEESKCLNNIIDKEEKYDEAIEIIENKLSINQIIAQNSLVDTKIHVDDEIYKNEFEKINKYLEFFAEAYEMLGKKLSEAQIYVPKEKYGRLEYLFFVVSHEFLSFLSHYSTAVVFFNSPRVFIDNLHKGIAHLKRALMDIYDGLIVEEELSFGVEYLRLRAKKINSLGNTEQMQDVMTSLKECFEMKS